MNLKIVQDFIPKGRKNRPGYKLTPKYVTIHNTANPNATAKNHADYIKTQVCADRLASWHFTVDDLTTAYQHLPLNENAWHCTDGTNGTGNRQSIGIEICEFTKKARQDKAITHGAWLAAKLLKDYNLSISKVKQHNDWYKAKNCPRVIRGRKNGWADFLKEVEGFLGVAPKPVPTPKPIATVDRTIGIKIDKTSVNEAAYIINNSTYIRGVYAVGLFGGDIVGKGDYVDITIPKKIKTALPATQKAIKNPTIAKAIDVRVGGKKTNETGYLINNSTFIRAAYVIELAGGTVVGKGDHVVISFSVPKPDLSKVVFRVLINGKQVIALTGFDSAKQYALAEYPHDKIELQNVETNEITKVQDASKPEPKPDPKPEPEPKPDPKPEPDYEYKIVGKSVATLEQAKQWAKNRNAHQRFIDIAHTYWVYGDLMGLRADVLYSQAAHETNFGKFTGNVIPEQNNWAGIKIKNPTGDTRDDHEYFELPEEGVRGHFNHMCAYVGAEPLGEPHDRYYIALATDWAGKVKYLEELSGKWAPSATYHAKIVQFLEEMIATPEPEPEPELEPEPDDNFVPDLDDPELLKPANVIIELLKAIVMAIVNWFKKGGK